MKKATYLNFSEHQVIPNAVLPNNISTDKENKLSLVSHFRSFLHLNRNRSKRQNNNLSSSADLELIAQSNKNFVILLEDTCFITWQAEIYHLIHKFHQQTDIPICDQPIHQPTNQWRTNTPTHPPPWQWQTKPHPPIINKYNNPPTHS